VTRVKIPEVLSEKDYMPQGFVKFALFIILIINQFVIFNYTINWSINANMLYIMDHGRSSFQQGIVKEIINRVCSIDLFLLMLLAQF
jgi:hypothetical protein